ncbi:hypothetical protein BKA62DRAFT_712638 [Auriculariales sp. MPI-PUGE-AT-0066]|nr:hypothetical protein BKA62DRAFT_712638 [Auriculariales sp. MPI-PUGE-AT-0066]
MSFLHSDCHAQHFPEAVVKLQRSVECLSSVAQVFSVRISASESGKDSAILLAGAAESIVSTIEAACYKRQGDLHVLAMSHLTVLREALDEASVFIQAKVALGSFKSFMSECPAETIQSHTLGIQELGAMLRAEGGVAQLLLDPAYYLGLADAKPSLDLPQLSTCKAVYGASKILLEGLATMSDLVPWPWKAIPRVFLQLANLIEGALAHKSRFNDLIRKANQRIAMLLNARQEIGCDSPYLTGVVEAFFADVQRIIFRLRVAQRVNAMKAVALTDAMLKILEDEDKKMAEALELLQTCFSVRTAYTVESIAASVFAIQNTVEVTLAVTTEIHTDVQVVRQTVQDTSRGVDTIVARTTAVLTTTSQVDAMNAIVTQIHDKVECMGNAAVRGPVVLCQSCGRHAQH